MEHSSVALGVKEHSKRHSVVSLFLDVLVQPSRVGLCVACCSSSFLTLACESYLLVFLNHRPVAIYYASPSTGRPALCSSFHGSSIWTYSIHTWILTYISWSTQCVRACIFMKLYVPFHLSTYAVSISLHVCMLSSLFYQADPERRLGRNGAAEVKSHVFFKNLDWELADRIRQAPRLSEEDRQHIPEVEKGLGIHVRRRRSSFDERMKSKNSLEVSIQMSEFLCIDVWKSIFVYIVSHHIFVGGVLRRC